MFKEYYYYLIAGLPDLFLDQEKKDINIPKLKDEMQELLNPEDYNLLELIHYEYDNYNFLNLYLKRNQEFSPLGKYPIEFFNELEENVDLLPIYIQNFLKWKKGDEDAWLGGEDYVESERVEKNTEVLFYEFFYDYISKQENTFIVEWYSFLRSLNNILTAINCRKADAEIAPQMVGGGDVVEALTRSQAPDFGLKKEVDFIDSVLQISDLQDIIERERKLDILKWEKADEITAFNYFTIERILAFFVKATIVSRWQKLDSKIGAELLRRLVNDLRATYELPKEFTK
jgi:hypothetical protein